MPNIVHDMNDWAYTFDPVSKEEWIKQIETDLRQKPLDSLQSEWWEGEPLIPLVHLDDVPGETVRLPDGLFTQPPRIAEWISTKGLDAQAVNKEIHEALKQDVQSVVIQPDFSTGLYNEDWLKGVFREIISIAIQPGDIAVPDLQSLLQTKIENVLLRWESKAASLPFTSLLEQFNSRTDQIGSLRIIYRFPSSGKWDITTALTFNRLNHDLSAWTSAGLDPAAFFDQCILVLEADKAYLKHIIQARVLHLLWANLKNVHLHDSDQSYWGFLECHIEQDNAELPAQFLIRASMSGLAAALSGTHTLCIHNTANPDIPIFYKRINRNIHHLLDLESGMYKGSDPLAGAYALDYHTKRWTQTIWDLLSIEK